MNLNSTGSCHHTVTLDPTLSRERGVRGLQPNQFRDANPRSRARTVGTSIWRSASVKACRILFLSPGYSTLPMELDSSIDLLIITDDDICYHIRDTYEIHLKASLVRTNRFSIRDIQLQIQVSCHVLFKHMQPCRCPLSVSASNGHQGKPQMASRFV